jgi:CheY-like chemotaxis protein
MSPTSTKKIHLLLVDDSEEFRQLVMAYLKLFPFDITQAEDGYIALELMKERDFDIVLMDLKMPMMDGITTTRLFREWEQKVGAKHLQIIALTAFSLPQDKENTQAAGFDEFMTKPVKRNELLEVLNSLVNI